MRVSAFRKCLYGMIAERSDTNDACILLYKMQKIPLHQQSVARKLLWRANVLCRRGFHRICQNEPEERANFLQLYSLAE